MCSLRLLRTTMRLVCAFPVGVAAQRVGVDAAVISTDHELLSSSLMGIASHATFALQTGPLSLRVGAERLAGTSRRIGTPCTGLVQPGTCEPEPMRDKARLIAASAGIGVRAITSRRIAVDVIADLSLTHAYIDSRGLASGETISADQHLWDGDIGVETVWSPWSRLPVAIDASVSADHLKAVTTTPAVDGYAPFENGFELVRLRFGVAWRL